MKIKIKRIMNQIITIMIITVFASTLIPNIFMPHLAKAQIIGSTNAEGYIKYNSATTSMNKYHIVGNIVRTAQFGSYSVILTEQMLYIIKDGTAKSFKLLHSCLENNSTLQFSNNLVCVGCYNNDSQNGGYEFIINSFNFDTGETKLVSNTNIQPILDSINCCFYGGQLGANGDLLIKACDKSNYENHILQVKQDGTLVNNINCERKQIMQYTTDVNGNLWYSYNDCICKLGTDGVSTVYNTSDLTNGSLYGLNKFSISLDGTLWILSSRSDTSTILSIASENSIKTYEIAGYTDDICIDFNNNIWALDSSGIDKLEGSSFSKKYTFDNEKNIVSNLSVADDSNIIADGYQYIKLIKSGILEDVDPSKSYIFDNAEVQKDSSGQIEALSRNTAYQITKIDSEGNMSVTPLTSNDNIYLDISSFKVYGEYGYASDHNNIYKIDGNTMTPYIKSNSNINIQGFAIKSEGTFYIVDSDGNIYTSKDGATPQMIISSDLIADKPTYADYNLKVDRDNNVYLSINRNQIYSINADNTIKELNIQLDNCKFQRCFLNENSDITFAFICPATNYETQFYTMSSGGSLTRYYGMNSNYLNYIKDKYYSIDDIIKNAAGDVYISAGYDGVVCFKENAVPLSVQSSNPLDNSSSFLIIGTISVKFNDIVDKGDKFNSISLKDSLNNDVQTSITIDKNSVNIKPVSNFNKSTDYTLTIPAGAIKSIYGSSLDSDFVLHFTTSDSDGVTFKDPVLDKVIREKLNKGPADLISPEDMQTISYLQYSPYDSSQGKIKDLSGLEYATNLSSLCFSNNEIKDLTPLRNLNNLGTLDLSNNKIMDLSPLNSLNNLTSLYISNTGINNIDFLTNMKNLTSINLSYDPITDYTPLESFSNISLLYLYGCKLNTNPGLRTYISKLTKLKYLGINNNDLTDISFIEGITSLRNLYANNNNLTNIKSIITNVKNGGFAADPNNSYDDRYIGLSGNNLDITSASDVYQDIKILKSKGINVSYGYQNVGVNLNLTSQYPENNSVGFFIDGLIRFDFNKNIYEGTDFSKIELKDSDGNIVNINCTIYGSTLTIKPAANLKYSTKYTLSVPSTAIEDDIEVNPYIEDLTFTTEPQYVTFNDANLTKLICTKLGKNSNITRQDLSTISELSAANANISDLSGIQYLCNLQKLYLNGNNITDVSPLTFLTKLTDLNLSSNKIKDITPLVDAAMLGVLKGGNLDISHNYLNISDNSQTMDRINTLKDMGINVIYSPQDVDESSIVKLTLPDQTHTMNISDDDVIVNGIYDYGIRQIYDANISIQSNPEGYLIEISGIGWNGYDQIKVSVNTDDYLYLQDVNSTDQSKAYTLAKAQNSSTLSLNVETADNSSFNLSTLSCFIDGGSGKYYWVGELHSSEKIPYDNYAFQINGYDDKDDYMFFKKDVAVNSSSSAINVSKDEYAAININFDNSNYAQKVSEFAGLNGDNTFNITYYQSCDKESMYLSKGIYNNLIVEMEIVSSGKTMYYGYWVPGFNLTGDMTFNLGTQLTSKIKFSKDTYIPDEKTGKFDAEIYDQFQNSIERIYMINDNKYVVLNSTVDFSQQGNLVTSVDAGSQLNYHYNGISIPDLNGVYDVTYNVKDSIIPINAEKTTLAVSGTDEPLIKSANPKDDSVEVKCSEPITINYSKNIASGDGFNSISLKDAAGNSVSITASISGSVLTISPQNKLNPNTKYTLIIPDNAIKNNISGTLAKGCTIEFTTVNYGVLTDITKQKPDDSDAQAMKNILTGGAEANSDQLNAADLDGDGKITSADYALLKRYLKGKIKSLPCN